MIQAHELRIGNKFQSASAEPETITIDLIDSIEETVNGSGMDNIPFEDLVRIPLTEQLISKLGFVPNYDNCPTLLYGNSRFQYEFNANSLLWQQTPHSDWSEFSCKYFHTLQNLFFFLTGTELPYTP